MAEGEGGLLIKGGEDREEMAGEVRGKWQKGKGGRGGTSFPPTSSPGYK